jgi:hypothetical protein
MTILARVDPQDLIVHLEKHSYHIVHFFGHGGFDFTVAKGYLNIVRQDLTSTRLYADVFAQVLRGHGTRLVFLNACESGRGRPEEALNYCAVAGALLDYGVPAVIAAQYSIPAVSAPYLSCMIYNLLVLGKPLVRAIQKGRLALRLVKDQRFFDWGIPVLYTSQPEMKLFPETQPAWALPFEAVFPENASSPSTMVTNLLRSPIPDGPSVSAQQRSRKATERVRVRVALMDIDSKVAFLPDLVDEANAAQDYYEFKVEYLPVPSGFVKAFNGKPQTFVPRLEKYLFEIAETLNTKHLCSFTAQMIAGSDQGREYWNHFGASISGKHCFVSILSTYALSNDAQSIGISFAKAVFYLAIGAIVVSDERWGLEYHKKTAGCLFDYCNNWSDRLIGLKKTTFDHKKCRDKIGDEAQLAAIDALLALELPDNLWQPGPESDAVKHANEPASASKKAERPDNRGAAAVSSLPLGDRLQTAKACKEYLIDKIQGDSDEETKDLRTLLRDFLVRRPGDKTAVETHPLGKWRATQLLLQGLRRFAAEYDHLLEVHRHASGSLEEVGRQVERYRKLFDE